jgi:hypothetical protein
MNIPSDQLRSQRELVKRHLDWLDAQIAADSGARRADTTADPVPAAPSGQSGETPLEAPIAPFAVLPEVAVDVILETHSGESGLSQGVKFGCVAIAAVIVLGFLFILFVLPRFLYGDRNAAPSEAPRVAQPTQPAR